MIGLMFLLVGSAEVLQDRVQYVDPSHMPYPSMEHLQEFFFPFLPCGLCLCYILMSTRQ